MRELTNLPILESLPRDFGLSGKWARDEQGDQLENIDINLGDIKLTLNGRADNLLDLKDFTTRAELDVADMSVLNALLDRSFEPEALTLSASITGTPDVFDVNSVSLQTGESDLTGEIRIDRTAKPSISGQVNSNHLDLRPFLANKTESGPTTSQDSTAPDTSQKVFDDTPVQALQESPVNLDLKIRVAHARLINTVLQDLAMDILWSDHLFQLNPFQVSDQKGARLDGGLLIDGQDDMPDLTLKLNGKDLRLGIGAAENQDPETYPPIELHIDLHGSGRTKHEIAKSVNGTIRVFFGEGLYAASGLSVIFSDFLTELLNVLNPFAKTSEYSRLECGVLAADVQSGVMDFDPILIHDEKITIISEGEVDLDSEKIDLEFRTKPRKGFGVSAGVIINSLIKVGGTLSSPGVELDAGSAVVSGGTAVATVGISLLAKSFADRFLSSKDPCGDARKKLDEHDAQKTP